MRGGRPVPTDMGHVGMVSVKKFGVRWSERGFLLKNQSVGISPVFLVTKGNDVEGMSDPNKLANDIITNEAKLANDSSFEIKNIRKINIINDEPTIFKLTGETKSGRKEHTKEYKIDEGGDILITNLMNSILKLYTSHIDERFSILEELVRDNVKVKVIIAGNPENNQHSLGTGYSEGHWRDDYGEKGLESSSEMKDYIQTKINELIEFKPEQVELGPVGAIRDNSETGWKYGEPVAFPSASVFHVWGANDSNWNLENGERISGGGQASYFPNQGPGVFGIVTTPLRGHPTSTSIINYSGNPSNTRLTTHLPPKEEEAWSPPLLHQYEAKIGEYPGWENDLGNPKLAAKKWKKYEKAMSDER